MKRKTKMVLIFSVSCIAAGALLTGAGRLWADTPALPGQGTVLSLPPPPATPIL